MNLISISDQELKDLKIIPIADAYRAGIDYITGRANKSIISLATPYASFNNILPGGFETGSITVLAGRPGSGKTAISSEISRNLKDKNPNETFAELDFQFEMLGRNLAMRDFSANVQMSVRDLKSVDRPLPQSVITQLDNYSRKQSNSNSFLVEEPCTVERFEFVVDSFCKLVKCTLIVKIDHTLLFLKNRGEKDKMEMLYNLGETMTRLKKKYPIIFIALNQLNRNPESMERLKEGTSGNYLIDSDLFGADALLQHTDYLFMINRPEKYSMRVYGPKRYEVTPDLLAVHVNKARDGVPGLIFMKANFANMSVSDWPGGKPDEVDPKGKANPTKGKQTADLYYAAQNSVTLDSLNTNNSTP